jgi:lysophospholipase L1-like esterase
MPVTKKWKDGKAGGTPLNAANLNALVDEVNSSIADEAAKLQLHDSDLDAISALTTTTFGRALLTLAGAGATREAIEAQQADADLTAIAALSTSAFGRELLTKASAAAARQAIEVDTYSRTGDQSIGRRLYRTLAEGLRDASIVVVGDSTSTSTGTATNWSAKFLDGLHALFPAYTIKFADWSDATHVYPAATEKYKGTGARTLTLWNCAVGGKNTQYQQAPYFDAMIASKQPDLIFLSHGHNHGGEGAETVEPYWRDDLTAMTELLNFACPRAELVLFAQNPRTDASAGVQALRQHVTEQVAQTRGYGFVNFHRLFLDADPELKILLADALHPNAAGYLLMAEELLRLFNPNGILRVQQPSSLAQPIADQYLTNGAFASYTVGPPDELAGWTRNNVTVSKDTTNYEGPNGYAAKQTVVAAGTAARLSQALSADKVKALRGGWVCLAARIFMATGRPGGAGRISLSESGGSGAGLTQNNGLVDGDNGFKWVMCARRIAADATGLSVFLNCDPAGGAGVNVTFDRAVLARGILPRDIR